MASTEKTAKGLNSWIESDKPVREDFLADNLLLDENALWAEDYDADNAVKRAGGIAEYVQGQAVVTSHTLPAGLVTTFAGATAPGGWLLCDGRAVSRTQYDKLFAAIGTAHGAGNGSTTFNLPDLNSRVPIGANSALPLGYKGGSGYHNHSGYDGDVSLSVEQMPTHDHRGFLIDGQNFTWNEENYGEGAFSPKLNGITEAPHRFYTTPTGGGQAHRHTISTDANFPPYTALYFIIKT